MNRHTFKVKKKTWRECAYGLEFELEDGARARLDLVCDALALVEVLALLRRRQRHLQPHLTQTEK